MKLKQVTKEFCLLNPFEQSDEHKYPTHKHSNTLMCVSGDSAFPSSATGSPCLSFAFLKSELILWAWFPYILLFRASLSSLATDFPHTFLANPQIPLQLLEE